MRARLALIACVAACGGAVTRTPRDRVGLVGRVLEDPRDAAAHLALAADADQHGRPGEALEHLQIVETLGGPLGARWHVADRERMARLLLARAGQRRARGAASALADLEHAQQLGAAVRGHDLAAAKAALALVELRHVDADERAKGRVLLAELSKLPEADEAWRGATANATSDEHGRFGVWLWAQGARREAYEQLDQWNRTSAQPGAMRDVYAAARAWWTSAAPVAEPPPRAPLPALETTTPMTIADAPIVAAAHYAATRFPGAPTDDALVAVARAFRHRPMIVDRLARDLVAAQVDEAAGHAALGALFDALGDPARSRAQWQLAVDGSAEPLFVRGLAEAAARTGDGSAAVIFATQAAAAWGDPAVVWTSVGDALESVGAHVDALRCAHSAVELAGPDQLPHALDLAIAASHALGRQAQVEGLRVQRVAAEPAHKAADPATGPLDPAVAVVAYRTLPTAGTIARMWVAARAHPADLDVRLALLAALAPDDPRHATIVIELAAFAGDPDPERALAAIAALR